MSLFETLGFGVNGWGGLLLMARPDDDRRDDRGACSSAPCSARSSPGPSFRKTSAPRVLGDAYTTVFRGVPELLVIYLFYFGGATLVSELGALLGFGGFFGLPPFLAGALGVGVISGAYQAEVYRGAFLAIRRGEIEAARAIGMAPLLRFRRIIAPQVLRFALPGPRQCLAAQPEGFGAGLGHRPRRAHAHEFGGGGLHPSIFPVLCRGRGALSRHDGRLEPGLQRGRGAGRQEFPLQHRARVRAAWTTPSSTTR